jgi:hypothetical protein
LRNTYNIGAYIRKKDESKRPPVGHWDRPAYVYTYIYIHTYIHAYIHTYIHTYIHRSAIGTADQYNLNRLDLSTEVVTTSIDST